MTILSEQQWCILEIKEKTNVDKLMELEWTIVARKTVLAVIINFYCVKRPVLPDNDSTTVQLCFV